MITLTIVRHGESKDNLRAIWAGWQDAPLSDHGMNQAKACGASLADTKIDAVFASPLKRALWTGQQIETQNCNKPSLTVSPLLREQNFGIAEGEPFGAEGMGGYIRLPGRDFTFPDGETMHDVRDRADEAIHKFIEPVLQETYGQPASDRHLVVVAHGIFNFEIRSALEHRTPNGLNHDWAYEGMTNTGWTRLEVGYDGEQVSNGTSNGTSKQPPKVGSNLFVKTLDVNVTTHLDGLEREMKEGNVPDHGRLAAAALAMQSGKSAADEDKLNPHCEHVSNN